MINKQSMWFLTLFSLVLVLGVYYVTMPNDLLKGKITSDEVEKKVNVSVSEGDTLIAMRANRDEKVQLETEKLETILTNGSATPEEKNAAFEELKMLNLNVTKESELESKLESEFGIKSYIEINNDSLGKPEVILHGTLESKRNNIEIHLTISHCKEYGTATAIIISK